MKFKYNFNLFTLSSVFVIISLLLIFNSFETLCEKSVELNAVNEENIDNITAQKLISRTGPTLLGVFADGVNHIQNESNIHVFNENKTDSRIFNFTKDINETIALIESNRPVVNNEFENISASVSHFYNNSSDKAISLSSNYYEDYIQSQGMNETLIPGHNVNQLSSNNKKQLHRCKQIGVETNLIEGDPYCILGPPPASGVASQYYSDSGNNIIPIYFYIPDKSLGESVNETSYISMKIRICCEPSGQLLIYDEVTKKYLLSFKNRGITQMCNRWENDENEDSYYESIISDSNKVRVEYVLPFGEDLIEEEKKAGSRKINFRGFSLTMNYAEVEFKQNHEVFLVPEVNTSDTAYYEQNSVKTFKLGKPLNENKKVSLVGVRIHLEYLDIDIDSGDFLLIGPGLNPTHRELSKAQIISQNIEIGENPKTIWVNADSAFIRLVTHNSMKKKINEKALEFSWSPANTTVEDIFDIKVAQRVKDEAIQICILDHSCLGMETNFKNEFIAELVHIINDYLTNDDHDIANLVSESQVLLFNNEEGIRPNHDRNDIFCQTNLAIVSAYDDQWPMIQYNTLLKIFFRGSDSKVMHSFGRVKVTNCSHEPISFWKMILPIIIILIVSILLMLMAWRYQYVNWIRTQRNAKYMKTEINDNNEDPLYAKDTKNNPIFVEVETPLNLRKTNHINKTTDMTDGNFILNNENVNKPKKFETSAAVLNQTQVNNEPDFDNLWPNPSTSQEYFHEDPPEYNHKMQQQVNENTRDVHQTDIPNINVNDRSLSSASDTIPSRMNTSLTGLHGTQHESLRAYPRSALRRPRTASENEYVIGPETGSLKFSKVQFELPLRPQPKRSPLLERDLSDCEEGTSGHENIAFVEI